MFGGHAPFPPSPPPPPGSANDSYQSDVFLYPSFYLLVSVLVTLVPLFDHLKNFVYVASLSVSHLYIHFTIPLSTYLSGCLPICLSSPSPPLTPCTGFSYSHLTGRPTSPTLQSAAVPVPCRDSKTYDRLDRTRNGR